MLQGLPLDKMAVTPDGVIARAGVFTLIKNSGLLRLIMDRRPWNYWERDLPGLDLPNCSMFQKLVLTPGHTLRMSVRDTSNYYYILRVPAERLPFQGIGPAVSREWWNAGCPEAWKTEDIFPTEAEHFDPNSKHFMALEQPVLTVVMMGDVNGVPVGQMVHRNVLLRQGVYHLEEMFLHQSPPPGTHVGRSVYR